jgi:hypothetical protein
MLLVSRPAMFSSGKESVPILPKDFPAVCSRRAGSCDAPSQKSAGDAFVASWTSSFPDGVKNATRASLLPFGDEASPPLAPGNFGVRV